MRKSLLLVTALLFAWPAFSETSTDNDTLALAGGHMGGGSGGSSKIEASDSLTVDGIAVDLSELKPAADGSFTLSKIALDKLVSAAIAKKELKLNDQPVEAIKFDFQKRSLELKPSSTAADILRLQEISE